MNQHRAQARRVTPCFFRAIYLPFRSIVILMILLGQSLVSAQLYAQEADLAAADLTPETTTAGIALKEPWRQALYEFCREKLVHSAWGIEHSERDFLLAQSIAQQEGLKIDLDVLFAAAFLHDVGTYAPYEVEGAEHSATAVAQLETLLVPTGFPADKVPAVKQAILAHMFYAETPAEELPGALEARVLHDADTLDFLGTIGIARIISLTTRHRWAPDLAGARATIENFHRDLPAKLVTKTARNIARGRVKQAERYLNFLRLESFGGKVL